MSSAWSPTTRSWRPEVGDYLVMAWPSEAAGSAAAQKAWLMAQGDWTVRLETDAMAVFTRGPLEPKVQRLPGQAGLLIGDVFDSQAAREGFGRLADLTGLGGDPETVSSKLMARVFGAYVAILPSSAAPLGVFREPMGGREGLIWSRDGVDIAASVLLVNGPLSPRDLAIDRDVLADLLRQKNLSSARIPLRGVRSALAGALDQGAGRVSVFWTPGNCAREPAASTDPGALERVVDGAVAALTKGRRAVLAEVSGGLDSAIVLASLKRAGAPVIAGLNHAWPQPEADERAYARAAADLAGIDLDYEMRGLLVLDADKLADVAASPRPSFNAADPDHDRALARALQRFDADALVTGQGGDAVFFQMASVGLVEELLLGRPAVGGRMAALAAVARRMRRSVWGLIGEAWASRSAHVAPMPSSSLLTEAVAEAGHIARHPWLEDIAGVSLAKQLQIQAITNNQAVFGASVRGGHGVILQPLLSQPVVEHCLAVPATILAAGDGDRAHARAAFAARLPACIRDRRHKGDLSVFFARSMAASLDFLRPWLMDGELVAAGLLDRRQLDAVLRHDHLIWFDHSGELIVAAILEAWTRHWSAAIAARAD